MEQLPTTLDGFYDRILLEIEEQDQESARLAMQWLAFAGRPISLKELAEAIIIQRKDEPYVNVKDRFLDYKDILEILPAGLVSTVITKDSLEPEFKRPFASSDEEEEEESRDVDKQDQSPKQSKVLFEDETKVNDRKSAINIKRILMVQFAHFSVKEYLVSNRPRREYQIDEISANEVIAESCFAYLIFTGIQKPRIKKKLFADFPLLHYAVNCWPHHMHILQSQGPGEHCLKLALRFLQYDSYAWLVWAELGLDDYTDDIYVSVQRLTSRERQISAQQSLIHPVTWVSGIGLNCLLQHLLVENVILDEIPQSSLIGNPLHFSAVNGQLQAIQLLLTAGSNPNRDGGQYGYALQAASRAGHIEIVRLLIQTGADVNASGGRYGSVLQAARLNGQVDIVQLLLDSGAENPAEDQTKVTDNDVKEDTSD